jgi:glycosyltransferase involved in cell wall biosynthesis
MPFVSFCFTTYKRGDYLKMTLESVLAQSFQDFEVIVSDNDPEESGRATVEGFRDSRFRYFPNRENLGMKKSFNKSLERSTGEYIVMIADDDPVYPDMLETLIGLRSRHPGYGMYLGGSNWYCAEAEVARLYQLQVGITSFLGDKPVGHVQAYSPEEFLANFFNNKIFISYLWSTAIVKREIIVEMGGIPDYGTPFLGDYAYISIMASHSGCVTINKALGHQTIHLQNFGRSQNDQLKTAAVNFPKYVGERLKKLKNWPEVEQQMNRFVGQWIVSHLAFLHRFYKLTGNHEEQAALKQNEKEILEVPIVKQFRLKYLLKKDYPGLHNLLVKIKRVLSPK